MMPSFSPSSWFGAPEKSGAADSTEANLITDNDLRRGVLFFHYGGLEGLPSFDPECLKYHVTRSCKWVSYPNLLDAAEDGTRSIQRGGHERSSNVSFW